MIENFIALFFRFLLFNFLSTYFDENFYMCLVSVCYTGYALSIIFNCWLVKLNTSLGQSSVSNKCYSLTFRSCYSGKCSNLLMSVKLRSCFRYSFYKPRKNLASRIFKVEFLRSICHFPYVSYSATFSLNCTKSKVFH